MKSDGHNAQGRSRSGSSSRLCAPPTGTCTVLWPARTGCAVEVHGGTARARCVGEVPRRNVRTNSTDEQHGRTAWTKCTDKLHGQGARTRCTDKAHGQSAQARGSIVPKRTKCADKMHGEGARAKCTDNVRTKCTDGNAHWHAMRITVANGTLEHPESAAHIGTRNAYHPFTKPKALSTPKSKALSTPKIQRTLARETRTTPRRPESVLEEHSTSYRCICVIGIYKACFASKDVHPKFIKSLTERDAVSVRSNIPQTEMPRPWLEWKTLIRPWTVASCGLGLLCCKLCCVSCCVTTSTPLDFELFVRDCILDVRDQLEPSEVELLFAVPPRCSQEAQVAHARANPPWRQEAATRPLGQLRGVPRWDVVEVDWCPFCNMLSVCWLHLHRLMHGHRNALH